jgi:predicted ATPase
MAEAAQPAIRRTCWCVITGAPCSGKTSVITELSLRGLRVVPEAARAYIDAELKKGRPLSEIKADPRRFESRIFRAKLRVEAGLPAGAILFLDRAQPDSIAYYALEGLDPSEPRRESRRIRYRRVFLFEHLEFTKDSVRSENAQTAHRIEGLIEAAYSGLGYDIIRVPVMPVPERVEFVLSRCRSHRLG